MAINRGKVFIKEKTESNMKGNIKKGKKTDMGYF